MATFCSDDDFIDYTAEELDQILKEVEKYEREEADESDVDIADENEDEEGAVSDPEDDIPLACLQATWRPAVNETPVRAFAEPTGPHHNLPETDKPLDYFFLFLPQSFYDTAAEETNH
ncbi:hypothetical protein BaRGS_00003116 [Batillaria attramentaria]|uniref:Uncharacterized protein n=1 Tax=Batillaria attramentaria TaxID=370345 RepID=A0ABD0M2P1_9CAEN